MSMIKRISRCAWPMIACVPWYAWPIVIFAPGGLAVAAYYMLTNKK